MTERIYQIMTWVILGLLIASAVLRPFGLVAMANVSWWLALALIVVWLIVRYVGKKKK